MKKLSLFLALAGSTLLGAGCTSETPTDELQVSCEGQKCDAFDSIRSLISDAKKLDLGDLLVLGAGYATDELNDALDVTDYGSIKIRPTEFYALKELVDQDLTLNDIDKLVSGLAARFGDGELSTEVNRVRAAHLRDASSDDKYFAESAFLIGANLSHNWNFKSSGIVEDRDTSTTIGFAANAEIEARIIAAYDDELSGVGNAPLAAIRAARGFILPQKLGDIRDMRPGESFALKGSGKVGINLGAGVPILVTEPSSFLTYSIVLTAGMRTQLSGQLDVQLVRLDNDQVVVDVGMEIADVESYRVGLRDGWGIHGLVEQHIDIAGHDVDLGRLVEKALQKELNKKLNLINADASTSTKETRLSVARMRFGLDSASAEGNLEEALAQTLKGDLRFAQALASRGDSGVKAEFDLLRSGVATASHAGLEIFGMHFFTTTEEAAGNATIQTPGGATSLIFESLRQEGGWFFSSHGYGRTGLAGLIFDAETGGAARGETNLFISVEEGDDFIDRDKLMDHLDGIILSIGGSDALAAMEPHLNSMERLIVATCPVPESDSDDFFDDSCNIDMLENNSQVSQYRNDARSALSAELLHLDQAQRALVMKAGELRTSAQGVLDANAALTTPGASMILDYRLDDGALADLFSSNAGSDLRKSVLDYLAATQVVRTSEELSADRSTIRTRLDDDVEEMAEVFDSYRKIYLRRVGLEKANIATLGEIGSNAIEVNYRVDERNVPDYENASSKSLAQARSEVALDFFDDLMEAADDIGRAGTGSTPYQEQTVAYGLLSLTDPERLDLRVTFEVDTSGCGFLCGDLERYDIAGYKDFDMRAKGPKVAEIGGGLFDIDSIINIK
ncbi:MAG: hypothetical protein GY811_30455 [Myxococcales bacterium]|nr:hypothetical protein [Myxococcales bacterium]